MVSTLPNQHNLCYLKKYVQVRNGILYFNDEESFQRVVLCLSDAIDRMSALNLNLGFFDEYDYVLEQFENMVGHSNSLRRIIAVKTQGLIMTDELTSDNDPSNDYLPDKVLQCFVNRNFDLGLNSKIINLKEVLYKPDFYYLNTLDSGYTTATDQNILFFKNDMQSGVCDNMPPSGSNSIGIKDVNIARGNIDLMVNFDASGGFSVNGECNSSYVVFDWYVYDSQGKLVTEHLGIGPTFPHVVLPKAGIYSVQVKARNSIGCESNLFCKKFEVVGSVKPVKPCCKAFDLKEDKKPYLNGARLLKVRLFLVNLKAFFIPIYSISADSRNYEIVRGKQRARKADLSIKLDGFFHAHHCNGKLVKIEKYKKRKSSKSMTIEVRGHWTPAFVKENGIFSFHTASGSANTDIQLRISNCK
jgi:hypothetical protein